MCTRVEAGQEDHHWPTGSRLGESHLLLSFQSRFVFMC